jgi:hypothetical protein
MNESFESIFDEYVDHKKVYRIEGESALDSFNQIARDLGYEQNGFQYGSCFEQFIIDNPGCCEVIYNWIADHMNEDWAQKLASQLPERTCDNSGNDNE